MLVQVAQLSGAGLFEGEASVIAEAALQPRGLPAVSASFRREPQVSELQKAIPADASPAGNRHRFRSDGWLDECGSQADDFIPSRMQPLSVRCRQQTHL